MDTRLTPAAEDYLKAILILQGRHGAVTTSRLSQQLAVAPASVTGMIQKLAQMNLVRHERYRGVRLSPTGRRLAVEVVRHHRLLELYLSEALGVPWDEVHEEAERLEHAISEKLEARIDKLLGHPTHDPHGSPIPTPSGEIVLRPTRSLSTVEPVADIVIAEVDDRDPEFLRYLGKLELFPGVRLLVTNKEPFDGPLTLALSTGEVVIGHEAASRIEVLASE